MYSVNDIKKGVVKTEWKLVRERFLKVDPILTDLIDDLSPDSSYPIYLVYFPYGMLKGDRNNSYLPLVDGSFCKMNSSTVSSEVLNDIGYGMNSSPMGVILDKYLEYFLEFDNQVMPYLTAGPGTIFNKGILANKKSLGRNYSPNGIVKATAGTRTGFMLPSINNHNGISSLKQKIGIDVIAPKCINDHFKIFQSISSGIDSSWNLCLSYFSQKWIDSLLHDAAWSKLRTYILNEKSNKDSFNAYSPYYEIFYSLIQKKDNLRTSSPYLTNTAIHLIKVALGEAPGFIPATSDDLLPLNEIQNVIAESFKLKKTPTIMIPHSLQYEVNKYPVYYSMQHPTSLHFLTKKNERVTANTEMGYVNDILSSFLNGMNCDNSILKGTAFETLTKNVEFNYFHNYPPRDSKLISNTKKLNKIDPRFNYFNSDENKEFCHEGQFLRGCVQVNPISSENSCL